MKGFGIIYAAFIFVLSCLPCGDAKECDVTISGISVEFNDQHSDHEHETENCTPFCNCSCCGSQVYKSLTEFHVTKILHCEEESVPFYEESFKSQYTGKIWQPPKIG